MLNGVEHKWVSKTGLLEYTKAATVGTWEKLLKIWIKTLG